MVISPENSCQRILLELFHPFQEDVLIKEETETHSRHTTWIVCWSLFILFKWNTWLKKKWKPISWLTTQIMVEIYYPTTDGSLFSEKFVHSLVEVYQHINYSSVKWLSLRKNPVKEVCRNYHFCFPRVKLKTTNGNFPNKPVIKNHPHSNGYLSGKFSLEKFDEIPFRCCYFLFTGEICFEGPRWSR